MLYDYRYETLRKLLLNIRLQARLTQIELAEKLGRGQSFVSKVESGEQYLDVLEFVFWCEACGASPASVITEV
jgi:transcriptional regulator with XRE-family HTH domain